MKSGRRSTLVSIFALIFVSTLASLLTSGALAAPPSKPVGIDLITANGTGCAKGTVAIAMSADNTAFTVSYSGYLAQVGVVARPNDARKHCQLNLHIRVPDGFTYAIESVIHRGFASLAPGATGLHRARYHLQDQTPPAFLEHSISGPLADDWQATDPVGSAGPAFAPCGAPRNLNVHSELEVIPGTSNTATTTSFMALDTTDGAFQTTYRLTWKACS
jgi:hypothetical protein